MPSDDAPSGVAVFLSYASLDNAVPDDCPDARGFVSTLHRNLVHELETELGLGNVLLWRDRTEIEPGDRWSAKIVEALRAAHILVVVLSRTYAQRDWCNRELETFASRLESSLSSDRLDRIFRVDKQTLQDTEIPAILRPIQAIRFSKYDRLDREDRPFFWRGNIRDDRFYKAVRDLALAIERKIGVEPVPPRPFDKELELPPEIPDNGRTVFVAKPAHEMRDAYQGVVAELTSRGYRVVPACDGELPDEKIEAETEIDQALADAELAVHLVGRRPGNIPHGADQGIVPLQLALSRDRAVPNGLARIIWAPKVLDTFREARVNGDWQSEADERDPLDRLADMGAALRPSDCLEGRPFAAFRELLIHQLTTRARPQETDIAQSGPPSALRVYVLHQENDRACAVMIAKALKAHGIVPWLPPIDGEPQEQRALHRQRLADCDAVVLAWQDASRTWVEMAASELLVPQNLQRDRPFRHRIALLAGKHSSAKREYLEVYSPEDADQVLDGTEAKCDAALAELVAILCEQPRG